MNIITKIANIVGNHIGHNTHTHDHLITPTNFKTINTIARSPQNPIPVVLLELFIFITLPKII